MNTSLHDLISTIESIEFDTNMSVFSGFSSFHNALEQNEVICRLKQVLLDSPKETGCITERLNVLLQQNEDPQYAHPCDVAIASYLYTLSANARFGLIAAEQVWATSNLIWAKKIAEIVLANQTATLQSEVKIINDDAEWFSGKLFAIDSSIQKVSEINIISSDVITTSIKIEDKENPTYPIVSLKSLTA